MQTYPVTLDVTVTRTYRFEVEASSEDAAAQMGRDHLDTATTLPTPAYATYTVDVACVEPVAPLNEA